MACITCEVPKKYCNARSNEGECKLNTLCTTVVGKCRGEQIEEKKDPDCSRIEGEYCRAYNNPNIKWRGDRPCPLADHLLIETKKKRLRAGQQKQIKWK